MAPRRRPPRLRQPEARLPSTAEVPAWARKRGEEYVAQFLARREERRRERIAGLIDQAPSAVRREGPEAVREWAEEWDALDPRVSGARIDAGNDPRAPLTARP